jgi:hypothetical protein
MTRSPDSLVPSGSGQPEPEKRDDKPLTCWQGGEANLRAATPVNAIAASSYPPAIKPIQLDLFPGLACPLEAKPATVRNAARVKADRRDGVQGGGTQRQRIDTTGEALCGPAEATSTGRKRIRVNPESAAPKPGRESEVAVVPLSHGKTGGREGPLLPSIVQSWERQPDCPRKGRLHPGPIKPRQICPRDLTCPRTAEDAIPSGQATARHRVAAHAARRRWSENWMREIRTSSSMRGRRKRATTQRACALLYRMPLPS